MFVYREEVYKPDDLELAGVADISWPSSAMGLPAK